jgi:hypothetical protein
MSASVIEEGDTVSVLSPAHPDGQTWPAYMISIQETRDQPVYLLYDKYGDRFLEVSQDAVDLKVVDLGMIGIAYNRWNAMCIFVSALDTGSAKLCEKAERLLRRAPLTEFKGANHYGDEDPIEKILAVDKSTLLQAAVDLRKYRAAQWVLDRGVKLDQQNRYKETALYTVCNVADPKRSELDMCKFLLEHGANPNPINEVGLIVNKLNDVSKILMLHGGVDFDTWVDPALIEGVILASTILTRVVHNGSLALRVRFDQSVQ